MGRLYSFDMFDTLVSRAVKRPVDVFFLMALGKGVEYRFPFISILGFKFLRVAAEKVARRLAHDSEDVTIFQIYRVLGWFIKRPSKVLRREIDFEFRLSTPINSNLAKLCELVSSGEKCCIVSDMYLPRSVLRKILSKHAGRLSVDIYVSSECKVAKWSGNLFWLVSERLGVPPENIFHLGDNLHSDVRAPSEIGINASHFKALEYDEGRTLYECFKCSSDDPLFRVGYELVGPLSIAFARYVNSISKREGVDRIIFSGRDSYLFKRAHDLFFSGESRYFRISRRAVYLAEVAATKDLSRLFEGVSRGNEFFSRIGLICPDSLKEENPYFNSEKFILELGRQGFSEFSKKELDDMREYLQLSGFSGKISYVDIGWRGSIQDSIESIVGEACSVIGIYFGTVVSARGKRGFFFYNKFPFWRYFYVFQALPIFEFLFTEPVRSLKKVSVSGRDISFEFVCDESEEQIFKREIVAKGAEGFFNDYARVHGVLSISDADSVFSAEKVLKRILVNPSPRLVDALSCVSHSAGFGGSITSSAINGVGNGFVSYLKSPWKAVHLSRVRQERKFFGGLCETFLFSWPFFVSYEFLKIAYRFFRRIFLGKAVRLGGDQ